MDYLTGPVEGGQLLREKPASLSGSLVSLEWICLSLADVARDSPSCRSTSEDPSASPRPPRDAVAVIQLSAAPVMMAVVEGPRALRGSSGFRGCAVWRRQVSSGPIDVPEELVSIMAFVIWENSGKPDGADYSAEAKVRVENALRGGLSVAEVKKRLQTGIPLDGVASSAALDGSPQEAVAPKKARQLGVQRQPVDMDRLVERDGGISDSRGTSDWMLDVIDGQEKGCTRSFMHRYNTVNDLLQGALGSNEEDAIVAIFVWLRFCASRHLVWNQNYNIKPREISAAQEKLTSTLMESYRTQPQWRTLMRMIMSTVGRGAPGNAGQRIRDEILDIQSANDCKGGFWEEWHQKLHNNTSPDDVVICQACLDYIDSGLDLSVWWKTLETNGIDKQRLLSYDRSIHSEPNLRQDQAKGMKRDLTEYLKTLKAVHCGADLDSAANYVFGYKQDQCKGKAVEVSSIPGVASPELRAVLDMIQEATAAHRMNLLTTGSSDMDLQGVLEAVNEARWMLRGHLTSGDVFDGRLKGRVLTFHLIDSDVGAQVAFVGLSEAPFSAVSISSHRSGQGCAAGVGLALEGVCLSTSGNEEEVMCLKEWQAVLKMMGNDPGWALRAKAGMDRIRLSLASSSDRYNQRLQPTAQSLGTKGNLNVPGDAIAIFTEEVVRGTLAAPLSMMLNRLDPVLREAADLGSWQVISPTTAVGHVEVVDELATVQNDRYPRPTVLIAGRVVGEEEIPEGVVALITMDMPDVLSHVSVRARNEQVCFATCFDQSLMEQLRAMQGQCVEVSPNGQDVRVTEAAASSSAAAAASEAPAAPLDLSITRREFGGAYAVGASSFTEENVGAKSRNVAELVGRLPEDIYLPTCTALPFGTFEAVLDDPINAVVKSNLDGLVPYLTVDNLAIARAVAKSVQPPRALMKELQQVMTAAGQPWPGQREAWMKAWTAITGVWASKWNERAFISCRKAGINHTDLCMAVLCQQVVPAEYAFVVHTTNPSTGNDQEIYAEVVKGLGETLVGNYPGRALSFSALKSDVYNPKVLGFPSKNVGLYVPDSLIFRSDSNGEDLEGYAGAGLYDSITLEAQKEVLVDYSTDPIVQDPVFQRDILGRIAAASLAIENVYGSPQDIEGCITRDGKLYVVQTRPQV
ncbi:alpha-glucan water dikinase [Cymbomonas tetramitiformis]|uniref:Alpha-glucan water dikinase n=1 Tax=Cymbomonas tetramitiformis TaxID=36881 RepID=A0AAE0GHV5_9CHLO|nr:alpha-glucan water dikinase [Cymbomonas tetramitiformis]